MPYFMKKAREPISSYTHFCGAILFGVGAILLFLKAFAGGETDKRTLFWLSVVPSRLCIVPAPSIISAIGRQRLFTICENWIIP